MIKREITTTLLEVGKRFVTTILEFASSQAEILQANKETDTTSLARYL